MSEEKAILLIHKYFHDGELAEGELAGLLEWLKDSEHRKILDQQIELDYSLAKDGRGFDAAEAYQKIKNHLKNPKKRWCNRKPLLSYAALFVLLLGLSYFVFIFKVDQRVDSEPASIILKLDKGTFTTLKEQGKEAIFNNDGKKVGVREGNSISYDKDTTITRPVYNTLYIPKGKTFQLKLSDETVILLNADTEIRYPINFIPGKERHIELQGEAYFRVARDSVHPFVAETKNQKVRVYGTAFNVKSYPEDLLDETVLVEGSVGVNTTESEIKLVPGEMAVAEQGKEIQVKEVEVERYTAWIQNRLVFQSDRFDEIIKVLERKFDVEIDNKYKELQAEKFTGSFRNDKELDEILNLFNRSRPFKYVRNEKQITISKPNENN